MTKAPLNTVRRRIVVGLGCAGIGWVGACASPPGPSTLGRVVVIGGGFGGSTAAKYLRMWSEQRIEVTMVEASPVFISCPMSNLVLGGYRQMSELTTPYKTLADKHGVNVVHDTVESIDPVKRKVKLRSGGALDYDRLVLSPGVEYMWDTVKGLQAAQGSGQVLQAWKAGAETLQLRRQLEAMPDGGVFAISIPLAPYRCPPGPYERACTVASYFKQAKPRSKVLILDANPDVTSKGALFKKAWAEHYPGMVEYRPQHTSTGVDGAAGVIRFEVNEDVKAQVLNVLPPMRAGAIARQTGLANVNQRWCEVDFLSYESKVHPGIHVLGDAILAGPMMPKSGHMANQQAKVAAAAIIALQSGQVPNQEPIVMNTCYSFVDAESAIHVASVHQYDPEKKTMQVVAGSGGVSAASSKQEGQWANSWAHNIWADMLA